MLCRRSACLPACLITGGRARDRPMDPLLASASYVKDDGGGEPRSSSCIIFIVYLHTHTHTTIISSSVAVVVSPNMNVLLIPYGLRPARTTALRQLAQNHSRSYHLAPTTSSRFRTGAAATNPVGRSLSLRSTLIRLGPTRKVTSVLGTLRSYTSSPAPLPPTPAQQAS
jgi:hypothetical protein